ncbi:hypothetical protein [Microbispora sp. H10670]|uniref:hypothetical protein n=1 Tax=Microbispora sp. H10670 TaxID=2729108 RepID=UPI0015FFE5F8|nr:hypothetical protein [Microbispora sp. H10670]
MELSSEKFEGKNIIDMIRSGELRVDQSIEDPNLGTREIFWDSITEARSLITELEDNEAEEAAEVGREPFVTISTYVINLLVIFEEAAEKGQLETVDHFLDAYEKILEINDECTNSVIDDWVIKRVRRLGEKVKSRCGPLLGARAFPEEQQE